MSLHAQILSSIPCINLDIDRRRQMVLSVLYEPSDRDVLITCVNTPLRSADTGESYFAVVIRAPSRTRRVFLARVGDLASSGSFGLYGVVITSTPTSASCPAGVVLVPWKCRSNLREVCSLLSRCDGMFSEAVLSQVDDARASAQNDSVICQIVFCPHAGIFGSSIFDFKSTVWRLVGFSVRERRGFFGVSWTCEFVTDVDYVAAIGVFSAGRAKWPSLMASESIIQAYQAGTSIRPALDFTVQSDWNNSNSRQDCGAYLRALCSQL